MQTPLNEKKWNYESYVKRKEIDVLIVCSIAVYGGVLLSAYEALSSGENKESFSGENKESFVQQGDNYVGQIVARSAFDLISIVGGSDVP